VTVQDNKDSGLTIFRAHPYVRRGVFPRAPLPPAPRARSPQFQALPGRAYFEWWESFKVVCTQIHLPPFKSSATYFRSLPVAPYRFNGRSLTSSLLLHSAGILLLAYLPWVIPARKIFLAETSPSTEKIYYRLTKPDPIKKLPKITPKGSGGRPGAGAEKLLSPTLGSTSWHPNVTIISKPIHPDNSRQIIHQPISPPDLRITLDLKLPNLITGTSAAPPKPEIDFKANGSRPNQQHNVVTAAEAPTLTSANTPSPLIALPDPSISQPHLPMPPAADAPGAAMAEKSAPSSSSDAGLRTSGDQSGLVILSTDPAPSGPILALPPGNRYGEFSISPSGGQAGSPGGPSSGLPGGGSTGGSGSGDGQSSGVGPGIAGGGGGTMNARGGLSISGSASGGENSRIPEPKIVGGAVYAVPSGVLPRKNALVVTVGPMGGGGLNVYGSLRCGRIYTVFLQMPGKGWTLQYCPTADPGTKSSGGARPTVIHLEEAILPPDPETRFDFQRVPLPPEKLHKSIILRGIIKEDGTVDNLEVYQGLLPEMDDSARRAFALWKFKPATRAGKTMDVQVLVGIPSDPPRWRPPF